MIKGFGSFNRRSDKSNNADNTGNYQTAQVQISFGEYHQLRVRRFFRRFWITLAEIGIS